MARWTIFNIEAFTYDVTDGLEQFLHSCAVAGSKIQGETGAVIQQMLDRAGMRVGEIENVNEVTNAGSVARVVVCA